MNKLVSKSNELPNNTEKKNENADKELIEYKYPLSLFQSQMYISQYRNVYNLKGIQCYRGYTDDCLKILIEGDSFNKLTKNSNLHWRYFKLTPDFQRLMWFSKNKYLQHSEIIIKNIRKIEPLNSHYLLNSYSAKLGIHIKYSPRKYKVGELKTLNILAKDFKQYQIWFKTLEQLSLKYHNSFSNDLKFKIIIPIYKPPPTNPYNSNKWSLNYNKYRYLYTDYLTLTLKYENIRNKHLQPHYIDTYNRVISKIKNMLDIVLSSLENYDYLNAQKNLWYIDTYFSSIEHIFNKLSSDTLIDKLRGFVNTN